MVTNWLSTYFPSLFFYQSSVLLHRLVVRCGVVFRNKFSGGHSNKRVQPTGEILHSPLLSACIMSTPLHIVLNWLIQTTETEEAYSLDFLRFPFFFNRSGFGIVWNSPDTCILVVIVLVLVAFLLSSCCVQVVWYRCDLKGHLLREGNWDAKHTFDNKKL